MKLVIRVAIPHVHRAPSCVRREGEAQDLHLNPDSDSDLDSNTETESDLDDGVGSLPNISATNGYLAVGLSDFSLHVFSSEDGSHIFKVVDHSKNFIWAHGFCGQKLVAGCADGSLRAWNTPQGCGHKSIHRQHVTEH